MKLNEKDWNWLQKRLREPAKVNDGLKDLFKRANVFDKRNNERK